MRLCVGSAAQQQHSSDGPSPGAQPRPCCAGDPWWRAEGCILPDLSFAFLVVMMVVVAPLALVAALASPLLHCWCQCQRPLRLVSHWQHLTSRPSLEAQPGAQPRLPVLRRLSPHWPLRLNFGPQAREAPQSGTETLAPGALGDSQCQSNSGRRHEPHGARHCHCHCASASHWQAVAASCSLRSCHCLSSSG